MPKINVNPLVVVYRLPEFWFLAFFLHKKRRKNRCWKVSDFFVATLFTFRAMNDGLYNFPGLWKISFSFCAYCCSLNWLWSPLRTPRETKEPNHIVKKKAKGKKMYNKKPRQAFARVTRLQGATSGTKRKRNLS